MYLASKQFNKLREKKEKKTVLYFYWLGLGEALPFVKRGRIGRAWAACWLDFRNKFNSSILASMERPFLSNSGLNSTNKLRCRCIMHA